MVPIIEPAEVKYMVCMSFIFKKPVEMASCNIPNAQNPHAEPPEMTICLIFRWGGVENDISMDTDSDSESDADSDSDADADADADSDADADADAETKLTVSGSSGRFSSIYNVFQQYVYYVFFSGDFQLLGSLPNKISILYYKIRNPHTPHVLFIICR